MKKIGIISDTHGFWDDKYAEYLGSCDEIWHAGDIGSMELADSFEQLGPRFRAVYGNCDDYDLRARYSEILRFRCEDADILLKHIGGYPGKYDRSVIKMLYASPPNLFVCGHSHILKVQFDKALNMLHINPGAYTLSLHPPCFLWDGRESGHWLDSPLRAINSVIAKLLL